MNKNYAVVGGVVVILVLGGLGFAFRHQIKQAMTGGQTQPAQQSSQTPTAQSDQSSGQTGAVVSGTEVDYTSSGFSPATVTVKKGTTVKFVNKSGSSMAVASNPHPIHTDYSGFDQTKSDQAGKDEYDFTFDKVGSWGFHNHLNPSDQGTVVVTE